MARHCHRKNVQNNRQRCREPQHIVSFCSFRGHGQHHPVLVLSMNHLNKKLNANELAHRKIKQSRIRIHGVKERSCHQKQNKLTEILDPPAKGQVRYGLELGKSAKRNHPQLSFQASQNTAKIVQLKQSTIGEVLLHKPSHTILPHQLIKVFKVIFPITLILDFLPSADNLEPSVRDPYLRRQRKRFESLRAPRLG